MGPDDTSFVFVIGTGRCGSTLVHEVLADHPDVGFVSNLDDRLGIRGGRWNGPLYRLLPPTFTRKGRVRFAPSEGYRALAREVSPVVSRPFRDLVASDATPWLADRFRRFFEDRAGAQRRGVFLHKFTGWPRAGFISAALPRTRFVHVVRDGRAVASSLVRMPWWQGVRGSLGWDWGPLDADDLRAWVSAERSLPVLAGLEWKILMRAHDAARQEVAGGQWLELRYEDFVAEPRAYTERLLSFMGLSWNDAFERRFARRRVSDARVDAFRKDLSSTDLDALDRVLGPLLERLGYADPAWRGPRP